MLRAVVVFLALSLTAAVAAPRVFEPPPGSAEPILIKHPVVLVHGIFHRDPTRGAYFRGVAERYAKLGVKVSFPILGFSNGVADRARRLAAHLDATWPTGKVNIIAHSIGGLAAREVITRMGYAPRVASLTTISTPHRGTVVADWVITHIGEGLGVEDLVQAMGVSSDALRDLRTASCAAFNARTPDMPGVAYSSLGGAEPWWGIKAPLQPFSMLIRLLARARAGLKLDDETRAFVRGHHWGPAVLAEVDRVEAQVSAQGVAAEDRAAWESGHGANDGVVPLASGHWGAGFREVRMDHLDQIGWGSSGSHSADFYEALARELAGQGL
jgi:hypothetical protein